MRRVLLIGLTLWMAIMACVAPQSSGAPTATPDTQAAIATMVAGTLVAAQSPTQPQPTSGLSSPAPPPSPTPTASTSNPALPGSAQYLWAWQGQTLTLYSATGQAIYSLPAENLVPGIPVHTPLPVDPAHLENLWLVYAAYQTDNKEQIISLVSYHDGQAQTEVKIGSTQNGTLIGMTGAPGQSRIAYSVLTMIGYDYHSVLYVHLLGSAPPTQSLYETTTSDGRVIDPLGVGPDGVWFTYDYFGAPMGPVGLYYIRYDGTLVEALPQTYRLLGFDAATGWVAYTTSTPGDNNAQASLTWRPLSIGDLTTPSPQTVTMPDPLTSPDAWPVTAAFSEGYIAWSTHLGSPMEGADYLRVFTLDGQAVIVEPPTASSPLFPQSLTATPVTWLQQNTLVLQGYAVNTSEELLILAPPNLDANQSLTLPGSYVGRAWAATP